MATILDNRMKMEYITYTLLFGVAYVTYIFFID